MDSKKPIQSPNVLLPMRNKQSSQNEGNQGNTSDAPPIDTHHFSTATSLNPNYTNSNIPNVQSYGHPSPPPRLSEVTHNPPQPARSKLLNIQPTTFQQTVTETSDNFQSNALTSNFMTDQMTKSNLQTNSVTPGLRRREEYDSEFSFENMASDTSSSILGDILGKNYVDTELERHLFTYTPFTPTRISQSSVPRPQPLSYNRESEMLYETGKNFGLIPTFGNHRIMDTGSASPIYVTPTFTNLPIFGSTLSDMRLPFGVLVQPFAQNLDEDVPELNFLAFMEKRSSVKRDLIRCKNCHAYYNSFMHTNSRTKTRVCNLCYTAFEITDEQMEALYRISSQYRDESPLKKGTVDFIAPTHYYNKEPDPGPISNLINKASNIGVFKTQQTRQESFIYDTYSVSPIPVESAPQPDAYGSGLQNSYNLNDNESPNYRVTNTPEETTPSQKEQKTIPKVPTYAFIIETTSQANKLNLRESVIRSVMNGIDLITDEEFDLCVFIFDSAFYMFQMGAGSEFSVNVVSEVDENFKPCTISDVCVRVTRETVSWVKKEYLERILGVQTLRIAPNSCGNFALNCVLRVMSSDNRYGTLSIFYMTQPDIGLGTDPQTFPNSNFTLTDIQRYFYDSLLRMCYSAGICVDVYLCPPETRIPGDIALQYISQQTGGNCTYMPRFSSEFDYSNIYANIVRLFTVPAAYKCELKLRCSKHIKVTELLCGFNNSRAVSNLSTMIVPRIGPDLSIGFILSLNHMVDNRTSLYIQCACLYTNTRGVQMVRVHTHCIKVISSVNEVFKNANPEAIMNLMSRKLAHGYIKSGKYNREEHIKTLVEALTSYRQICAPSTPKNQLILPDNLKFIPAHLNSFLKYNVKADIGIECAFEFVIKLLRTLNASPQMTFFTYTRTYCLHRSINERGDVVPEGGFKFSLSAVPSSGSFIYSDGIYLMDDGYRLLLFVGPHVKEKVLKELFGPDYERPHGNVNSTQLIDTNTATNLMGLVEHVRSQHKGCPYAPLKIIPYTAKNSKIIKTLLLEDELGEEPSYITFLVSIHKSILESVDRLY
uniref:Protein transport protein sec24-like, putative n=1 Tax=Theileria annulata TaxID=5874 RepID=A0A3B0MFT0_THEAN